MGRFCKHDCFLQKLSVRFSYVDIFCKHNRFLKNYFANIFLVRAGIKTFTQDRYHNKWLLICVTTLSLTHTHFSLVQEHKHLEFKGKKNSHCSQTKAFWNPRQINQKA